MRYLFTILVCLLLPGLTLADENLLTFNEGGLSLSIKSQPGGGISLHADCASMTSASAFSLSGPERVVIDLQGPKLKANKQLSLRKNALARSLRIGVHENHLRLVLDLQADAMPALSSRGGQGSFDLELKGEGEIAAKPTIELPASHTGAPVSTQAAPADPSPTKAPTAQPSSTPKPKATATATSTATPTKTPRPRASATVSAPPRATETAAPPAALPTEAPVTPETEAASVSELPPSGDSVAQVLKGITFDYISAAERTPVVRIVLTRQTPFRLIRKDDRGFELNIPECNITSPALGLPQFPPQDFAGFTFLDAKKQGDEVVIAVDVDRGIKIASLPHDNEIWLRITNE